MEQNKDQGGAITLERAGFKLASHVATPGGPIMACVTDVYEKDGVQLVHSYAMGGESWSIGAAVRGEAVAVLDGWKIGNACNGRIAVMKDGVGGYSAELEDDNIASSILYELACSLRYGADPVVGIEPTIEEILAIAAPFVEDESGFFRKPELFEVVAMARAFMKLSARAADAPSNLRQALIDVRHAIQFSHDSVGGIDKMPVMMHHSGTVVEFIDAALSGVAVDAPSEPSEHALWDDNGEPMNDAAEKEWRQCNERIRQRAAHALDSQPTDLSPRYVEAPTGLSADVLRAMQNGFRNGESVERVHFDVMALFSSQPTDGGVRNG